MAAPPGQEMLGKTDETKFWEEKNLGQRLVILMAAWAPPATATPRGFHLAVLEPAGEQ